MVSSFYRMGIVHATTNAFDCYGSRYYAFGGCSANPINGWFRDSEGYYHEHLGAYYNEHQEAAKIVCCTLEGDSCSRKLEGGYCRSGDNDDFKVTWKQARDHCEAAGMRLCNSQAELNQCCNTGCNYDYQPVWSSAKEGMLLIILFRT